MSLVSAPFDVGTKLSNRRRADRQKTFLVPAGNVAVSFGCTATWLTKDLSHAFTLKRASTSRAPCGCSAETFPRAVCPMADTHSGKELKERYVAALGDVLG